MHELVERGQLLLHRGAQLLGKHYPRLMAQQVVEVIEDAARRGELVADEGVSDRGFDGERGPPRGRCRARRLT